MINDEKCLSAISYETPLKGPFLGIIDAFISLSIDKPIEAIDRMPEKELDRYLRDDPKKPCMTYYNEEFYEVLSIGEMIKNKLMPKEKDISPKLSYSFLMMSLSEQLDFIEEIFSYYYYGTNHEFSKLQIEDVEGHKFFFQGKVSNEEALKIFLKKHSKLDSVELIFS